MEETIKTRCAFSALSKKNGKTYYLHSKEITLKVNRKHTIYYFAGIAGLNAISEIPEGFEVFEMERTGLPMLRKKRD